jgi:hypothetical protein
MIKHVLPVMSATARSRIVYLPFYSESLPVAIVARWLKPCAASRLARRLLRRRCTFRAHEFAYGSISRISMVDVILPTPERIAVVD